jgi:hypothetical protein
MRSLNMDNIQEHAVIRSLNIILDTLQDLLILILYICMSLVRQIKVKIEHNPKNTTPNKDNNYNTGYHMRLLIILHMHAFIQRD